MNPGQIDTPSQSVLMNASGVAAAVGAALRMPS